jgi:hypothetical protein
MTFKSYAVKVISKDTEAKASTVRNCWGARGKEFAEFTAVFEIESEFSKRNRQLCGFAGKVKILGDIVSPIVDEQDWECLK